MTSTLTAELLISVDGWAGSDNLPGFFGYMGPELEAWMAAESAVEHLALMGRKSYEMMNDLPDESKDDEWEKMTQQDTVVFSRTLTSVDWPAARVADDLIAETTRLKGTADVPLRTVLARRASASFSLPAWSTVSTWCVPTARRAFRTRVGLQRHRLG